RRTSSGDDHRAGRGRIRLFARGGFLARLRRLQLAAGARVGDEGGNLRLRQSGGGHPGGLGRRRTHHGADPGGHRHHPPGGFSGARRRETGAGQPNRGTRGGPGRGGGRINTVWYHGNTLGTTENTEDTEGRDRLPGFLFSVSFVFSVVC